jgi:hypothetical protein
MRSSTMNRKIAALTLACGLTLQGCGLDEKSVPESLIGPAELGLSLQVLASPDILLADGLQTSAITALLQDQNGKRVGGRGIVFTIMDSDGRTAEIGQLTSPSGARVYGSTTATTDSNGVARVVYTSPERRDFTADERIKIGARPVGTDSNGAPYWTVSLELRSAEPRRFPQVPGNTSPTCNFNIAPNNPIYTAGTVLRFFSTASDADPGDRIVRYEWYFGDGSESVGAEGLIDVQHPYPFAGTYFVTHIVTDRAGAQSACSLTVNIAP